MDDCPHDLGFGNGWRSSERQAENYRRDPDTYAPPGYSYHEPTLNGWALAVDLLNYQPAIGWANDNAERYGLVHFKNVNGEPWHFQPMEIPKARRYFDPAKHKLSTFPLPGDPQPPEQEDDDMYIDQKVWDSIGSTPPLADIQAGRYTEWFALSVVKAMYKSVTGTTKLTQTALEKLNGFLR